MGSSKTDMRALIRQKAKEAEQSGGSGTLKLPRDMEYFKPVKGKNEIIIVPFTITETNYEGIKPGSEYFRLQVLMHFRVGPDEKTVICPRTVGKPCPICQYHKREVDKGADKKSKEMKAIEAKKRDLFNIVDLGEDEDTVKIWEIAYYNFGSLLQEELRECEDDSPILDFACKDDGSILIVRMVEETMGKGSKPFLKAKRIDFEERNYSLPKKILDQAVAFDTALIVPTYEQLNAMFYDLEEESVPEEGAEDAERSFRRDKKKRDDDDESMSRRRRPRESDSDADDESAQSRRPSRRRETEEAGKDEEKPARGSSRRRGKEPEPEIEKEPEAEKPARSRRRKNELEDDDPPLPKRGPKKEEQDNDADYDTPKKDASNDQECPEGGVFGKDCDSEELYDKCEECNVWQECRDAADAMIAQSKRSR